MSWRVWKFKSIKFLTLIFFYIVLISECIPFLVCITLFKKISKKINLYLIIWFAIKCISDISALVVDQIFGLNFFPIFHISVLLENLLLISYVKGFIKLTSFKYRWFYILPFIIFLVEIIFFNSIYELNKISLITNYLSISILLFISLFSSKKIEKSEFPVVRSLFVFHCISFIYFLFDPFRRFNDYISEWIYPIYAMFAIFLNLHFLYYVWSKRKI